MRLFWYIEVRDVGPQRGAAEPSFGRVLVQAANETEAYTNGPLLMKVANGLDRSGHSGGRFMNDWVFLAGSPVPWEPGGQQIDTDPRFKGWVFPGDDSSTHP